MSLFADDPPRADPHDPDEQRALVALSLVAGVGPARVRAILAHLGSAAAALAAPPRRLATVEGVGSGTAAAIASGGASARVEADRHFALARRAGATFLGLTDPAYPPLLKRIYDPPPYLWVRGEIRPEDGRAIAVVGTRRATEYGRRVAEHFAGGLAAHGLTVVSGLAYGVDVAAHRAALDAGGRTIAVLGSGVDRIYPARHASVVRRILDEGLGAVVSEFPPGAPPDAVNFPRRNRIVAGLSLGVLVAEARQTGGALITAMAALEQNREVFAVPAPLFADMDGTNLLIRRGCATLVTSVADVLEELAPILGESVPTAPVVAAPEDLNPVERRLYEALGREPIRVETLCDATELDPSTALVYLLQLEFRGLVRQLAGKQFFRV